MGPYCKVFSILLVTKNYRKNKTIPACYVWWWVQIYDVKTNHPVMTLERRLGMNHIDCKKKKKNYMNMIWNGMNTGVGVLFKVCRNSGQTGYSL